MSDLKAAERARWLAELAEAIEQAQQLAWQIGARPGANSDARELYGRLELARVEVESLRRTGWAEKRDEYTSEWIELLLPARTT